jgi:broad specificity phosphatase PhoE
LKLILVRHGETSWNRENRIQGQTDVELSDFGRIQADRLALSLKNEKFEAIVSSPLKRALETAKAIARFHPFDISLEKNLQELDHGDFESLTMQELQETHGNFLKAWLENPASFQMPNGESLLQLQERTWKIIDLRLKTSIDTLVVSHGMAIMSILCKIQNINLSQARKMFVNTASKTVVEFKNGQGTITLLNDTSHLKNL